MDMGIISESFFNNFYNLKVYSDIFTCAAHSTEKYLKLSFCLAEIR